MARINLKLFRVKQDMSQDEIAHRIGCNRTTYAEIENGKRDGREAFWKTLQRAFDIPDEEMWALVKNE